MEFPNITVPEGSSCNIVGVVREYVGGPEIGSAAISSATCQIDNLADSTSIRAAASIASDIDADGNLDSVVTGAENAMIDDTKNYELHVATIRITGTSGDGKTVTIIRSVVIKVTQNPFES